MNVSKGKCKHPWKKLEENENSRGEKRVCAIVNNSSSTSIDQDEIIKKNTLVHSKLSFNIVRESHLSGSWTRYFVSLFVIKR